MKKGLLLLLVLILIAAVFTGCNKNEDIVEPNSIGDLPEDAPDIEDIPALEDTKVELKDFYEANEATIYTMVKEDESVVYLQEESPGIIKLQMAVTKYGELSENIDFNTVTGKETYPVMSPEAVKSYEAEGVPKTSAEHYKKYGIIKHFTGVEKYNSVEIDGDTATIDVIIAFTYDKVENLANYIPGKTYYRPQVLEFKIVDGEWLLNKPLEFGQIFED